MNSDRSCPCTPVAAAPQNVRQRTRRASIDMGEPLKCVTERRHGPSFSSALSTARTSAIRSPSFTKWPSPNRRTLLRRTLVLFRLRPTHDAWVPRAGFVPAWRPDNASLLVEQDL